MSNPWFRMYSEFATDPKVQMLCETDQRRFVMLLCLRCSNGDVTLQDDAVTFQLRISNEEWQATKSRLIAKNLIGEDNLPIAWDKRQYVSDSSKSRVSKHRAKLKQACNVTVTPPDTDSDTDSETEDRSVRLSPDPAREATSERTPAFADLKKQFNGSTEALLQTVEAAMGGDCRSNAEQWLSSTVAAHGASAVAEAHAMLIAKRQAGEIVAKPLVVWSKTAGTLKAGSARPTGDSRPQWMVEKDAKNAKLKAMIFGDAANV